MIVSQDYPNKVFIASKKLVRIRKLREKLEEEVEEKEEKYEIAMAKLKTTTEVEHEEKK